MEKSVIQPLGLDRMHFAVMAVEATACAMGIGVDELYDRLERVGLMDRLVLGCYDVMHTQSLQTVVEDLREALRNWEASM